MLLPARAGQDALKHLDAPRKPHRTWRWLGLLRFCVVSGRVQKCTALSKLFKGACFGWSWEVAQGTLGTSKVERQSLLSQQMSLQETPGMLDSHFRA